MIFQPYTKRVPKADHALTSNTQDAADSSDKIATTEFVHTLIGAGGGTGSGVATTTAVTQPTSDSSTKLANTEFVHNVVNAGGFATVTEMSGAISSAVSDKATTSYVDEKVSTATTDMATQTWTGEQIASATTDIATQTWANGQIATATTDMATQTWTEGRISATDSANRTWTTAEIETAVANHTDATTQALADRSTKIATDEFVHIVVDAHTDAATQDISDKSTKIATTAYVRNLIGSSNDYEHRAGISQATWYQNTYDVPLIVYMEMQPSNSIHISKTGGSTSFNRDNAIGNVHQTIQSSKTMYVPVTLIVPPGYFYGFYYGSNMLSSAVCSRLTIGTSTN